MDCRTVRGVALSIAVIAVSFGAILVRLAEEAPPIAAAAWRLSIAALLLAPFAARRREGPPITRRQLTMCAASGAFLALHFMLWIASLHHTSVASSVVLVSTNPVFILVGSALFLRERASRGMIAAVALSMVGIVLIGWGGLRVDAGSIVGDAMALGGALMASGYLLIGRAARQTLPIDRYAFLTYATAAGLLLLTCLAARQPLVGFSGRTTLFLVLMAVGPQLIGHSTFNWALKALPASTVALVILGEPIGSTILAFLILGETVTLLKAVGGVLILIGIYIGLYRGKR